MSGATIKPSPEIWHRDDFPILCNWRKLWRAVEVGVDRGEYASLFLDRWQGDEWYGVDDYRPYGEMPYDREADYLLAVHRLSRHARRAKLLRHGSGEAAAMFTPGWAGFVYLDGAHTYEAVKADLAAWWPVLADHGILAGHDWTDQPVHEGVKRAVSEFAAELGLTVYLTTVKGYQEEACPSWYVYKSGMPGPGWRRC